MVVIMEKIITRDHFFNSRNADVLSRSYGIEPKRSFLKSITQFSVMSDYLLLVPFTASVVNNVHSDNFNIG